MARAAPWRETRDPYAILVSEMMLQQTRVETVLAGGWFPRWLARFPDAETLAQAEEPELLGLWQGLGYYNRARHLQRAAREVLERHGGQWPRRAAELRELPGIGGYTAAAVASLAFDEAVAAVDGNVLRVLARVTDERGRIDQRPARTRLEALAQAWVPGRGAGAHNAALMELGQRVCTPRRPRCGECPIAPWCRCARPEELPRKGARATTLALTEFALWAVRPGCRGPELLLAQEQGSRRCGFWRLPLREEAEALAANPVELARFGYAITRHKVDYRIFEAPARTPAREHERWWSRGELEALPLTAPSRKALRMLGFDRETPA